MIHNHFYDTCAGHYPTALQDDNYKKETSSSETRTNQAAAAAPTFLSAASTGSSYTSMAIPMWVSSKTNPTAESLSADKYPVKLKWTTISGRERVFGLHLS